MLEGPLHHRWRLVAIFVVAAASGLVLSLGALRELRAVSRAYEVLLKEHVANAIRVERLNGLSEKMGRLGRSFLLTGDKEMLSELTSAREEFAEGLKDLNRRLEAPRAHALLGAARAKATAYDRVVDRAVALRARGDATSERMAALEEQLAASRSHLDEALAYLVERENDLFKDARASATDRARWGANLLAGALAAVLALAGLLAWMLSRTLLGLGRSRAELSESLARLEAANRDLDAFAGRIAHDLRNILAPLPLTAQGLSRSPQNTELVQRSANRIETAARRAEGLIESLLAFARAGRPPAEAACAEARPIVGEVVDALASTRSLVQAELSVDVEEMQVRCAPALFYTVVANLLSNALKYVEGRDRREVRITCRRLGPLCELTVVDTGPGIPPEMQARIFEPFFKVDGTRPGTGIGLATVERIVRAYDGRISVSSRPGEGTAFVVRLPVLDETNVHCPPETSAQPQVH